MGLRDQSNDGRNDELTDGAAEKDEPTDQTGTGKRGPELGRRSLLKLSGTALTAAGIGTMSALGNAAAVEVSDGDGYEVWTVSGQEVYDLSDGEDLSYVLVDQTADGACLTIRSQNKSDWTVRNVGFVGVGQAGDGGNRFHFQVSVPGGGAGLIENVWANGKARDGQSATELGGIYVRSSHAGHLDIRHTYIEGFGNNAVYGSAVGKDSGKDGSVAMENCYHRDNTVSQFRFGSPESSVRNCVGVLNDPDGDRGWYPGTDGNRNARGMWGKHFRDQRVENSAFYISPDDVDPDGVFEARYIEDRSHGEEAVAEISGCDLNEDAPTLSGSTSNATVNITDLGESPTVDVIQDGGVPTTPKMAARGEREMPPSLPGESDDDTGEVTSLSYGDDAVSVQQDHYDTADAAGVAFSMANTADQELTVTHLTVTPQDSSIDELHDESSDVGRWVSEVQIAADGQDAVCDVPGSAALPNTFDLATDGWDDAADEVAVMSAGSSASVALSRFEDGGTPVDMTGQAVDIGVGYELGDGTTATDSVTVTPDEANVGPTVDALSVSEVETDGDDAEFDVDWAVGDTDGNLDAVDLTLVDDTDGETEDTASLSVAGDAASGTTRLVAAGDDVSGHEFTAELMVTDADGATSSGAASVTEDDPHPVVSTDGYADLAASSVTLHGTLEDLGGADTADVAFDCRQAGADAWNRSATESISSAGSFSGDLANLSPDTAYEYRAVAVASDGQSATGSVADFTTEAALDRTLTIDGTDAGWKDYVVAVSGAIENDPDNGSFNDDDSIDGRIASGFVNGGVDGYVFSGEVVGIEVDGEAPVLVDGEAVEPDSLVLPNTVVFDADGSEYETTYAVEVSGEFVNDPLLGVVEEDDTFDDSIATGTVTGDDRDGFRFSGDLVSLRLDGEASVVFKDNDG